MPELCFKISLWIFKEICELLIVKNERLVCFTAYKYFTRLLIMNLIAWRLIFDIVIMGEKRVVQENLFGTLVQPFFVPDIPFWSILLNPKDTN